MNKGHDQIAQGSQDLRSMARAKAGAIFKKSDITHVMRPVFNAPMSPNQFKQALETSLLPRKGGDDVNHLKGGLASLFGADGAGELSHLGDSRPILLQIIRKSRCDLDVTNFPASALQIDGLPALLDRLVRLTKLVRSWPSASGA